MAALTWDHERMINEIDETLLHHVNALQARVRALENHVEVLTKSLRTWDPETWECLREMVQELCEGNGQPEVGT
jgi:archaellum component FlaC